jgi:hypothetical protein
MNPQDLPGGLAARITGLAAGLLRHGFALGALAAAEGRLLVRQSLFTLLLAIAMALVAAIAYVALIGAVVALAAEKLSWGWPVSLAAAGMIHVALLAILFSVIRGITLPRPFEATTAELKRDIENLGRFSGGTRPTP